MTYSIDQISQQVELITLELLEKCHWNKPKLLVIGCSTSEIMGQHIGTAGAIEIANSVYKGLEAAKQKSSFIPVFQCCEHLNRALVLEEDVAEALRLPMVHAVPVAHAGGSMAAYAFKQLNNPCLVEHIEADAGIDIGDTLIGMHLKHVAVPVRASIRAIGSAHLTMAMTRPKLIGGQRAVYEIVR